MTGSKDDVGGEPNIGEGNPRPFPIPMNRRWQNSGSPGLAGIGPILSEPNTSTPLDSDDGPSDIPNGPLWAMKFLRHRQFESSILIDDQIRWATSDGDLRTAAFVIDDGDRHCMLSRMVGSASDQTTYHLVARVKRLDFEEVRSGWTEVGDLWEKAREFTLCAVAEGDVSNVVRVETYRRFRDIPADYRSPSDLVAFDD